MIVRFGRYAGRNKTTNVECGFNFVKRVSMADIKLFKVGAKLKELNPDATAVREAAKRGFEDGFRGI